MTSPNPSALQLDVDTYVEAANCDKHGEFESKVFFPLGRDHRPIKSGCPKCAAIAQAERAEHERRRAEAERMHRVGRLLDFSGIPARFSDRTLDGYAAIERGQKFALTVCKRFLGDFPEQAKIGRSLVMTGAPGTGKTHLACAVLRGVIETYGVPARFVTVSDMLRQIKETYRRDSEVSEREVIERFSEVGLLVVDELGVQIGSEHEKLLLFEVLNARYQELMPTILISNLSADDLEEFLGHRVMDRYRECGVVLAFDWDSYRGSKAS